MGAPTEHPPSAAPILATINLERGLPLVAEALKRFDAAFDRALADNARILKVIHGYGSGGKGGKIRDAFRLFCHDLLKANEIAYFVPGEDGAGAARKQLAKQFPNLAKEGEFTRGNPGITWVVLKKS